MRDPGQMGFFNLPLMTHAVDTGKGEKKNDATERQKWRRANVKNRNGRFPKNRGT